jgi:hypothetical protein
MALQTPVITVERVTIPQKSLFIITFRMVSADDSPGFDGIDVTHDARFRPGDDVADKTADVIAEFQSVIDDYQSAKQLQESPGMMTALTTITNGLVV